MQLLMCNVLMLMLGCSCGVAKAFWVFWTLPCWC